MLLDSQITYSYTTKARASLSSPLFRQFFDDNPGHRIPPSRRVSPGIVGAGPHPQRHIHQSCFDALTQSLNWKERKKEGNPTWKVFNCFIWHSDEHGRKKKREKACIAADKGLGMKNEADTLQSGWTKTELVCETKQEKINPHFFVVINNPSSHHRAAVTL